MARALGLWSGCSSVGASKSRCKSPAKSGYWQERGPSLGGPTLVWAEKRETGNDPNGKAPFGVYSNAFRFGVICVWLPFPPPNEPGTI
jgi:hypothetical protein